MFKPKSKNIYSIFQNQRTYEELNKWLTEACPVINDEKNNKSEQKEKINITEILENQNLTTENEYIKNEQPTATSLRPPTPTPTIAAWAPRW